MNKKILMAALVASVLPAAFADFREDPAKYWNLKELSAVPSYRVSPHKESAYEGLEALLVSGKGPKGTSAEFFCYLGKPAGKAPAGGWPGVVLVHGGGGTAYPHFTRQWTEKGFVVIAPDWYNQRPAPALTNVAPTETSVPRVPLAGGRRQDHVANVANMVLAHSLLRSLKDVNKDRTAFVGLSWGSWYGACVAAVDDRFKGCVEIYCGDKNVSRDPKSHMAFINGRFLHAAKIPMWWAVSTNDRNVTPETSNAGFAECARFDGCALVNDLPHSHCGFQFDSVARMAQYYVGMGKRLPRLGTATIAGDVLTAPILDEGAGVATAQIAYTCSSDPVSWKRPWHYAPAELKGGKVVAKIPLGAVKAYLAVYEKNKGRFNDRCGTTAFVDVPHSLAQFDFNEGQGACADDAVSGLAAMLRPGTKWARGTFGTALAVGEKGSGAFVEPIPGLDGAASCSIALRFRKSGTGSGDYPALLSSTGWGPGRNRGGVIFSTRGKGLTIRLRSNEDCETSFRVMEEIPEDRWVSVVLTFDRPSVKAYVDGKLAASTTWDHLFAAKAQLQVGGWYGSFGGFIDDLRVYAGALDATAVAEYASASGYEEVEGYQDDGTGGVRKTELADLGGTPLVTLKGKEATLTFDNLGFVLSLKENASGRELVAEAIPFVVAVTADGRTLTPRRLEKRREDKLAFVFPGKTGEAVVSVKPFDGGWTFTLDALSVQDLKSFSLGCIRPACNRWGGTFANVLSDEKSAVCVRSYGLYGDPKLEAAALRVDVPVPFPAVGLSVGLAAGPRAGFREQLKGMTVAAGVPRSDCGGPWSMGADQSRRSYVFADVPKGNIDYWIDFVKRSGFSIIHISSSWSDCLGPYTVNKNWFAGDLDEMKAAAQKVHDAGLQVGIHTLTACISPHATWIHPVCTSNLVSDAVYTLAAPLAPDSTEIVVAEPPIARHSTVYTYSSNGNVMRLGGELIQYSAIRRTKPYAFTGLKRGAFGTKKTAETVLAGAKIDYLHQRYCAFYPAPDSELADRLADRLGEVYNTCNLDELYFDGSEGMGTRYGIDTMRHKVYSRLKANNGHSPSIEASCGNANNWWFQTRMATTDHGVYGVKRFHDWHIRWGVQIGRQCNFLEPQMGWWQPRLDVPRARGHMLDEMEYFAGKNAGHDAAMSLQGVSQRPLPVGIRRQMAVLGWYEHARLGRAFAPDVQKYLAGAQTEGRLRQDDDGVWKFTDLISSAHRAGHEWERSWNVTMPTARAAALRVEALYRTGEAKGGKMLLAADEFTALAGSSATGVKVSLDKKPRTFDGGKAFALAAENESAEPNAAWAAAVAKFDFPGKNIGAAAIAYGVWVKGDGSGALLNLQLTTPGEFVGGISEHYVKLDFTGWKRVTFLLRERDSAHYADYVWPYGGGYASIYRNFVTPEHIATFAAYLNGIPKGKRAAVEISEVTAYRQEPGTLEQAVVSVNGTPVAVPFVLKSGEYAELDGGSWTRFSALGERLERVDATAGVTLKAGDNAVAFSAAGEAPRAEVTFFAFGKTVDALVDELTDAMRREMRYEAVMPFEYAPAKGLTGPTKVAVRPGEEAKLGVEIVGPCANPTFAFARWFGLSEQRITIPAVAAADETIVCANGRDWKVVKSADGVPVKEGTLEDPLPSVSGSQDFSFSAEVPDGAFCVVDMLKEYF